MNKNSSSCKNPQYFHFIVNINIYSSQMTLQGANERISTAQYVYEHKEYVHELVVLRDIYSYKKKDTDYVVIIIIII